MHSYNYKGGTITCHDDGRVTAHRHWTLLHESRSEPHAKAALTRYHRKWVAEREAEHHAHLREIWNVSTTSEEEPC